MKNNETQRRGRGRPRAFDRAAALGRAAETFWRLGYEGASIADLTAAMGITPQSLYAAFASKAELYREALGWYRTEVGADAAKAFEEEADIVVALERMLAATAVQFSRPSRPRGCMISTGVLTCAAENDDVARHVAGLRMARLAHIRGRIERGIAEGQLRADTDAMVLARFVGTIVQGMSVQALDGADEPTLLAVAAMASGEIARHRAEPARPGDESRR